jgi:hypothetical protein
MTAKEAIEALTEELKLQRQEREEAKQKREQQEQTAKAKDPYREFLLETRKLKLPSYISMAENAVIREPWAWPLLMTESHASDLEGASGDGPLARDFRAERLAYKSPQPAAVAALVQVFRTIGVIYIA